MFDLDALLLARIQFAFTISFHILFPALSIGLASYLAVLEGLWLGTRKPVYLELYQFWIKVFAVAFGMGVGITAIGGGLMASTQTFQPYIGFDFVIVMFAGVVLGGLGSILGAFWGGLTIGMVQQMSTLVLPHQL